MIRFAIGNRSGQLQTIDAVIDAGYTGFLSVPREIIVPLNLPWTGIDRVTLGVGLFGMVSIEIFQLMSRKQTRWSA
jgi:predicted aspartyl protease